MASCRDVEGLRRMPRRAQEVLELRQEDRVNGRRPVVPGHADAARRVAKVREVEREAAPRPEAQDARERAGKVGRAVGSQAHHLVLVAIGREPQVLGDREVEEAERVGEVDAIEPVERCPAADGPRGADEVAEAVDGADGRLLEGRDEKRAGEMRRMMLDPVQALADVRAVEAEGVAREPLPRPARGGRSARGPRPGAGSADARGRSAPCATGSPAGSGRSRSGPRRRASCPPCRGSSGSTRAETPPSA